MSRVNHNQRGSSDWGCLIFLLLVVAVWVGLSMLNTHNEIANLPNDRAWAQNEIGKLSLPEGRKATYLGDIAAGRNKQEVEGAVWKARWEGDPAYRAERTVAAAEEKEAQEASERITRWGLWIAGPGILVLGVMFVRRRVLYG